MSQNLSWKERFARRTPVQAIDRVPSGLPVRYRLQAGDSAPTKTVVAALALARRHVPMIRAKRLMDQLAAGKAIVADVPVVEDSAALEAELRACGLVVDRLGPRTDAGLLDQVEA